MDRRPYESDIGDRMDRPPAAAARRPASVWIGGSGKENLFHLPGRSPNNEFARGRNIHHRPGKITPEAAREKICFVCYEKLFEKSNFCFDIFAK